MTRSLQTLACALSAVGAAAQGASWDAALHLLSPATVEKSGATCLDGSPAGYYIRTGAKATSWKFHFQGELRARTGGSRARRRRASLARGYALIALRES